MPTTPLYQIRLDQPKLGLPVLSEREMGEGIDALNWIWTKQGAPIRALPEFNDFLRDFQLTKLWDKYGAPDLCEKTPKDQNVCA